MERPVLNFVLPADGEPAAQEQAQPQPAQPAAAETPPGDQPPTFELEYLTDATKFGSAIQWAPVKFALPSQEPALSRELRRELLSAYVLHGWFGVEQMAVAAFGAPQYTDFLLARGLTKDRFWGPAEGDDAVERMRAAVDEDRRPLFAALEVERTALRERIAKRRAALAAAAVEVARVNIATCRALLLHEAMRYLSLAEPREDSARLVLDGGSGDVGNQGVMGPRGPDAKLLVDTLRELQQLLRESKAASNELLAGKVADVAAAIAQPIVDLLPLAPLLVGAGPATDAQTKRARRVLLATDALSGRYAGAAAGLPILFRLLDADPDSESDISRSVTEILQYAWRACKDFNDSLGDADQVWTLPTLIERTVNERFERDIEFTERVAASTLDRVARKIHPFEAINYVVSGLDTVLVAAPLPPLQLAMLVVSMLANVGELAETWVREGSSRYASRAALDPSLALASSPSLLNMVTQALVMAIGVLPVKGLAAEVKSWRAEAKAQGVLRENAKAL